MSGQPQPDRASSLPADQVFRLKQGSLTQIAARPRAAAPKRTRPALSLVKPDFNPAGDGIDRGAQRPSVFQEESK